MWIQNAAAAAAAAFIIVLVVVVGLFWRKTSKQAKNMLEKYARLKFG